MHKYHVDGSLPQNGEVFVFGSNLGGIHGAGAAKVAYDRFGAVWGKGTGWSPDFRSYAIPTKNKLIDTMQLQEIKFYIEEFVWITKCASPYSHFVTRIGCGLAGFKDEQIAPLFREALDCSFAEQWKPYLE